jgi:hypothetical protein
MKGYPSDRFPLIAALTAEAILFVPIARLLDSLYPGPHAGFTLLGVWLFAVVPAILVIGAWVFWKYPLAVGRRPERRHRLLLISWLLVIAIPAAGIAIYRTTV